MSSSGRDVHPAATSPSRGARHGAWLQRGRERSPAATATRATKIRLLPLLLALVLLLLPFRAAGPANQGRPAVPAAAAAAAATTAGRPGPATKTVLGRPKRYKLAHAFPWDYSHKG